mgnify:CR=1 FL=1
MRRHILVIGEPTNTQASSGEQRRKQLAIMIVTAFYKTYLTRKNEVKIFRYREIFFVRPTSHHRIMHFENARPLHQDWISVLLPSRHWISTSFWAIPSSWRTKFNPIWRIDNTEQVASDNLCLSLFQQSSSEHCVQHDEKGTWVLTSSSKIFPNGLGSGWSRSSQEMANLFRV